MIPLSLIVLTFVVAAVPVGQVIARYAADVDLHAEGSGNIGATNVARVVGKKAGALTLLLDVLKGAVFVVWANNLDGPAWLGDVVALVAVVAHCFTPYLRWRGGKGVATSLGVVAALAWPVALVGLATWGLGVGVSRKSSVGALLALPAVGVAAWFFAPSHLAAMALLVGLVLYRHTSNLQRLWAGTENTLDTVPPTAH